MKKQALGVVLLSSLSFSIFAKSPNLLCTGVTGSAFTSGDGTLANPYLVCNPLQFATIGSNATLLNQNFTLGADLNFNGIAFQMIGTQATPFQGKFNGNGYTLSSITLPADATTPAIFPHIKNAAINNLFINGLTSTSLQSPAGGLAALSEGSTLTNIRISNLNIKGSDYSGGLIGNAQSSIISRCSVQGIIHQTFGTDGGAGFIGYAYQSQISSSVSHVNLVQADTSSFGVSDVGGLFGLVGESTVTDCYADGNIDYSSVTAPPSIIPHRFGGLMGQGFNTTIRNAYYAGKMIALEPQKAENVGGAAGLFDGGSSTGVFWDILVSGKTESSLGIGETTCLMKQKSFWLAQGYDPTVWILADGVYPKLLSEA